MDDICQIIKKQYPINYSVLPNGGRPLSLILKSDLPESVRESVQTVLNRFMLPLDEGAELEVKLGMEPCPDSQESCLTLRCGKQCFYLSEGDPYVTLGWTLYALTQGISSLNTPYPRKLLAMTYSADQQCAAASLLATVEGWGHEQSADTLKELMQKAVSESLGTVCGCAPMFSGRPLTQTGWRIMQKSRGLFAKKQEWELLELSNTLFGRESYLSSLNIFCAGLSNNVFFQERLSESVRALAEELYTKPLTNLEIRLGEAIRIRQEELKKTEMGAQKAAKAELTKKTVLRSIIPNECFKAVDRECGKLAAAIIERQLLEEVQKYLSKTLGQTLTVAQRGIWDWRRSLQSFCKIAPTENRLPLGWNCFCSTCTVLPQTKSVNWDGKMLQELKMNAGTYGRYIRAAWFCAPLLRELSEIDYSITYPVVMTGQPVVALMEDLLEVENHE